MFVEYTYTLDSKLESYSAEKAAAEEKAAAAKAEEERLAKEAEEKRQAEEARLKAEQERLAQVLGRTRAKFILIIKNTPFIHGLYEGRFHIQPFDNRYTYNVRSRNDRKAEHLVVTNYDPMDANA